MFPPEGCPHPEEPLSEVHFRPDQWKLKYGRQLLGELGLVELCFDSLLVDVIRVELDSVGGGGGFNFIHLEETTLLLNLLLGSCARL